MIALATWLAGTAAFFLETPWWIRGILCLPAVLWAPGLGWARVVGSASRLQQGIDAAWISTLLAVVNVCLLRWMGGGAAHLLGLSLGWLVAGEYFARGRRAPSLLAGPRWGLAGAAILLAAYASWHSAPLSRSLDTWWYHSQAQALGESTAWEASQGFSGAERFGWPEDRESAQGAELVDPEDDGGSLEILEAGREMVLLQGPVGASLSVGLEERVVGEIQRDVTEVEEEGPVPRYLDRGAVAVAWEAEDGPLEIRVTKAEDSRLFFLPGNLAVDSLHRDGRGRLVHYYQVLNIVENQRWAAEVLEDRALTINQPPLWSYVLSVSTLLVDSELPGASVLLLWILMWLAASGVRLLALLAPRPSRAAWLLPGAMAVVHLKLMLEPGSLNFPDSLYATALIGGLAALLQCRDSRAAVGRFVVLGLAAGLLRYPGTITLSLWALLALPLLGASPRRALTALWASVLGATALFAAAALFSGQLSEWLTILWFETIPEHFANNPEASPLLERPIAFYLEWLRVSGLALLLTLPLATRGARWVMACALVYSLMLCTIDHMSSHYFLPLVALTAVAIGANEAGLKNRFTREFMSLAALIALTLFIVGWSPWIG